MTQKKRAPSKKVTCEVCGKKMPSRGLKGHIKMQHPNPVIIESKLTQKQKEEWLGIESDSTQKRIKELGIKRALYSFPTNKYYVVVNRGLGSERNEYFDTAAEAIAFAELGIVCVPHK